MIAATQAAVAKTQVVVVPILAVATMLVRTVAIACCDSCGKSNCCCKKPCLLDRLFGCRRAAATQVADAMIAATQAVVAKTQVVVVPILAVAVPILAVADNGCCDKCGDDCCDGSCCDSCTGGAAKKEAAPAPAAAPAEASAGKKKLLRSHLLPLPIRVLGLPSPARL